MKVVFPEEREMFSWTVWKKSGISFSPNKMYLKYIY